MTSTQTDLERLGWNQLFENSLDPSFQNDDFKRARVISARRSGVMVNDGTDEIFIENRGRWYFQDNEERPAVGDWLLLPNTADSLPILVPRRTLLRRRTKGSSMFQVMAANVDVLFVVTSCNAEFNESRIERYLALAEISNIESHVVITKCDLNPNHSEFVARAETITPNHKIIPVNSLDLSSLDAVVSRLVPNRTGIFVGSSGVGKSTIANTVLGSESQKTREVRVTDQKGRHTTTMRSLLPVPTGGLIIDVPGTREVGLVGSASALPRTFPDVERFIEQCRFSNCTHRSEPGCQIQLAFERGELTQRRMLNYQRVLAQASREPGASDRKAKIRATRKDDRRHRKEQVEDE